MIIMSHRDVLHAYGDKRSSRGERGYSLIEIVIAITILMIMSAISLPYFFNYKRMYKTEDEAIKIIDLLREANQLALNRRRVIRVEVSVGNAGAPTLRMIDERGTDPDVVIKTIPLDPMSDVRIDTAPAGVPAPPPNYPAAVYNANVWIARFRNDGTVVNAADVPISATLYLWRPVMSETTPFSMANMTPGRPLETRAVTIFGGSGAIRYWKFNGTAFVAAQ